MPCASHVVFHSSNGSVLDFKEPRLTRHEAWPLQGADLLNSRGRSYAPAMDPLHATIEEFAARRFPSQESDAVMELTSLSFVGPMRGFEGTARYA